MKRLLRRLSFPARFFSRHPESTSGGIWLLWRPWRVERGKRRCIFRWRPDRSHNRYSYIDQVCKFPGPRWLDKSPPSLPGWAWMLSRRSTSGVAVRTSSREMSFSCSYRVNHSCGEMILHMNISNDRAPLYVVPSITAASGYSASS